MKAKPKQISTELIKIIDENILPKKNLVENNVVREGKLDVVQQNFERVKTQFREVRNYLKLFTKDDIWDMLKRL